MKKWLSITHWSRVYRRIFRLLVSPDIPVGEKLLFLVPVLLYWVLPDLMPMMPFDDIAVTMLAADWISNRLDRKYPDSN